MSGHKTIERIHVRKSMSQRGEILMHLKELDAKRLVLSLWVSGSRTYYFTYVLIMMSGVYLISQLPENNQSRTFKVLCGYFLVLALLLIMMYTKIL